MTTAATLKITRLVHGYTGLFFAPTILFFAITGGLQMFGLHESSRGGATSFAAAQPAPEQDILRCYRRYSGRVHLYRDCDGLEI